MDKFLENFRAQFEETELSQITGETVFRSIEEWSSLISLSVIAMVDEEYGVTLKGDDIRSAKTVKDLYDIIVSK